MNMELIRKQLEGIETPEVNLTHHDILNEIRARKNRRRSNLRIVNSRCSIYSCRNYSIPTNLSFCWIFV